MTGQGIDDRPEPDDRTDDRTDDAAAPIAPVGADEADGVGAADDPLGATQQIPPIAPVTAAASSSASTWVRRRVRVGTVVLGLVLVAVAVTVWVDGVLERHVSVGGVATLVMIGAGTMLLGGAVLRQDSRAS